jgi:hypothetical protein
VHGGQALISGASVIVPHLLKVAKEAQDTVEGKILESEPGDLAAFVRCHVVQEETYRISVAAYGSGS